MPTHRVCCDNSQHRSTTADLHSRLPARHSVHSRTDRIQVVVLLRNVFKTPLLKPAPAPAALCVTGASLNHLRSLACLAVAQSRHGPLVVVRCQARRARARQAQEEDLLRLPRDQGGGRNSRHRPAGDAAFAALLAKLLPLPTIGWLIAHLAPHGAHAPLLQLARDECTTLNGPEAPQCQKLIEAHKQCLRGEGFNVGAAADLWQ